MRDYAVRDKSNHSRSKKRKRKEKKVAKFMYHVDHNLSSDNKHQNFVRK